MHTIFFSFSEKPAPNEYLIQKKPDKLFLTRIGLLFIVFQLLVMGVSALDQAVLQIQGMEKYSTNGTSIPAGTYPLQYVNSISTLVFDNTTISNITYSLGVDNMGHIIYIQDSQYATTNDTDITWVFPNSLEVNRHDRHLTQIKTDFYSMQYLPMTLSRTMNQTQFSGEGYQKASFTVSFENITYAYEDRLCDSLWTGFNTYENQNLNATLLPDTFSTDAPGTYSNNSYGPSFNWDRSNITLNRVYNFSIIIRVVPNGTSPVIFKPYLGVVLFNGTYRTSGTSGTSTTMPVDMLPPHMTYATASQNVSLPWDHYLLYGKGASFDEIKNKVSSAPVANFSGTPTTGTAPLTVTFTDTSTNSPASWNWTFGDGNFSVLQNPVHTYTRAGTYTVSLNATNSAGSNTTVRAGYIHVIIPIPGFQTPPTDPDGDGIYEDLNGNGRLDFADVVLYFNQMEWIAANEPVSAFDLNGNTRIDFADIVKLFGEI
jgi:PKD repeat protein